jgi:uncharacterized glyoxalase superfamily protein PhnB
MKPALDFYQSTLGFKLTRGGPEEDNISLDRGDAHIMLESAAAFYSPGFNEAIRARMGGRSPISLYIEAEDLEQLHDKAKASGANVIDPLAERPWGQSEFTVEDPEGNWLTFWKAIAPPTP